MKSSVKGNSTETKDEERGSSGHAIAAQPSAALMSFTIHGIGVSGGIAIGHAQLVSHAQLEVAHYNMSKSRIAEEQARFDAALVTTRAELAGLGQHIPAGAPAEFEAFLDLHLMILDDPTLSEVPKQ